MIWLGGSKVLLVVTLLQFASAFDDPGNLNLTYPRRQITQDEGTSATLTCKAWYNFRLCGLVEVAWYQLPSTKLTDVSRYITTVNETVREGDIRLRQVVTEIVRLTLEDNGEFQCNAECENGETAKGHIVGIDVE